MWEGITVSIGTTIDFEDSFISDARKALYFPPGYSSTQNELITTTFRDNAVEIWVGTGVGPNSILNFNLCRGNIFEAIGYLNDLSAAPGGWAQAGILISRTNLIFGTAGAANIFRGLYNGIRVHKSSHVWIANCEFRNMTRHYSDNTPINPTQGTGIYSTQSRLTVTRPAGFNPCRFEANPSYGIYSTSQNGPVNVEGAVFTGNQRYGIFIARSIIPAPIVIGNNSFNLNQIRCRSAIFCVRPPGNSSATNTLIYQNQISIPSRDASDQTGSLIDIAGITGSSGTNGVRVYSNTINSMDLNSNSKHGIYITGVGNDYDVYTNHIRYKVESSIPTTSEYSNLGIVFDNMPGTGNEIYSNNIRSILTSHDPLDDPTGDNSRSLIKCAIHVHNANSPNICNNDVDSTYRGIHFSESCFNTFYGLNKMRKHVFGFHAIKNTTDGLNTNIDNQINTGNLWRPNSSDYIDGGFGAAYADDVVVPFEFRFNPSSGSAGLDPAPPSADPNFASWFFSNNESNSVCNFHLSFSGSEIEIAEGEYPYNTPAQDWDLQRHLWNKLLRNPGIEEGVTEIEDFMGDPKENPTSAYLFAEALYNYEKAFYPDSIWQVKWNTTLSNIAAKKSRIAGLLTALSLDTLDVDPDYADSLATAWNAMGLYQDTLRILADTFAARRDVKLANLNTGLNSLPSDYDWEKAWIKILEVAIRYGQEIEMDSTDRADLLSIANSCPADIGLAAQAVIAYMHPSDADPFKGCGTRLEECEEERGSKFQTPGEKFLLFPNPAYKYLTVLPRDTKTSGKWKILSSSGIMVAEGNWNFGQSSLHLDISSYSNGFYLFQMDSASGQRSTMKFFIVK